MLLKATHFASSHPGLCPHSEECREIRVEMLGGPNDGLAFGSGEWVQLLFVLSRKPDGVTDARVQLVPTFEDAQRLWRVWVVEWGGEGIVLKDRRSIYRPGTRSRSWWKAKHKLVLSVEVLQCASELGRWGDWGYACVMAFVYRDPRTGQQVKVEQAVRVAGAEGWTPRLGRGEILCWGVLRSGLLRHRVFL
jgi:ATP dependent DNA ligase domain